MTAQTLVDFLHEAVEMHPLLGDVRHEGKKAIHQEAFAATDTTPEIDASDDAAAVEKTQQAAALLAAIKIFVRSLQFPCSNILCIVRRETVLGGTVPQELDEIGGQR